MKKLFQPFYFVTLSPWPLLMSFSTMIMLVGILNWMHNYSLWLFFSGIFLNILISFQWWRDVIRESTFQGFHTTKVVMGLKLGMMLFIISEILFFF